MGNFLAISSALGTDFSGMIFKCRRRIKYDKRLDGKVALITGGNNGIGKETAYQLSVRGAKIVIGARNMDKCKTAIADIKARHPMADMYAIKLDLASLQSVRQFAKEITEKEEKIDILVNNAGVPLPCPELQSADGYEMQFAANHLGHFLLTLHLLPLLKKSSDARVISVSTNGHMFGQINFENINLRNGAYGSTSAHMQSKLAQVLFTRELAKRLGPDSAVKTFALNPGFVNTRSTNNVIGDFFKNLGAFSVEKGAQTYLYCALDDSLGSGYYYDNCRRVERMATQAIDDNSAQKLWELSSDLVKLEEHLKI